MLCWIGWSETAWTPSGFKGWTTGKRPSLYQRLRYVSQVGAAPVLEQTPLMLAPVAEAAPVAAALVVSTSHGSVIAMRPRRSSLMPPSRTTVGTDRIASSEVRMMMGSIRIANAKAAEKAEKCLSGATKSV